MNVKSQLQQKLIRRTKRQGVCKPADEPFNDVLRNIEAAFFEAVVGSALGQLEERLNFNSLCDIQEKSGVLQKFNNAEKLSIDSMESQCAKLEGTLNGNVESDDDRLELTTQNLPPSQH